MIVDSSAIMAIVLQEPDSRLYLEALAEQQPCRMSVANWLGLTMVIESRGQPPVHFELDDFMRRVGMEFVPVTVKQARVAREGWRRFGRGKHKARLNYGDCFAYALSKTAGETLLFKGNDFGETDIEPALKS